MSASEFLRVRTDEADALSAVEARGQIVCRLGEFEAHGDTLTWDVAQDVARLSGHCRLFAAGIVMDAESVELHPRAGSFRVVRSTLRVAE